MAAILQAYINGKWVEIPAIKGLDGFSPLVEMDKTDGVLTIKVVDAEGGKQVSIDTGAGDMQKSVYDKDGDGIVDNAEKLGGYGHSSFRKKNEKIDYQTDLKNVPSILSELDDSLSNAVNSQAVKTYVDGKGNEIKEYVNGKENEIKEYVDGKENEIKEYVDGKEASNGVTITIPASAWTGEEAPFTATVACSNATASNILHVSPAGHANSAEQRAAITAALITATGQGTGTITLIADGEKPMMDIYINVVEVI